MPARWRDEIGEPVILDGHRLYLARSLAAEQSIADALRARAAAKKIHILLGGPGTGKTTKVAKDLVERFGKLAPGEALPPIALAAPTGKAAARITEAVKQACAAAGGSEALLQWISSAPARTIHKLLGFNPSRAERFAYHAKEPLPYRLVIIDEASMISSTLMHYLLAAVDPAAEFRLVGDPNQLASVDAGTVLGDIAISGDSGFQGHPLHGCIETLEKICRHESANILGLGKAVRTGNTADALARLAGGSTDIEWIDPADATKLNAITKMAVTHAKKLHDVANGSDPGNVLKVQSEFQVLCGYREGEMGVSGWNTRIEKGLGVRATDPWYVGRPVMITRNTPSLRLANGDVGVIVPAGDRREAIFGLPGQSLRVPVAQLEDIDTVHAFTIHKSQGSEYDHVVVVLPDRPSRIVTRELLYTGITRARTKVTIVGLRHVIAAAIETPIRRATGLAARLAND